jgi:probable biosynthetic protein (TIGR04098 family)
LSIPHLLSGGLSENWLLKELGDIHWEMISKSLNTKSNEIIDSNGERLYASFVRLQWKANESLLSFKENDEIEIGGEISLYGNKMFFSKDDIVSGDKRISASLMSVFSSRKSGDNQKLTKGKPLNSEAAKLKKHKELPDLAKGFFDAKTFLFSNRNEENESNRVNEFYDTQFPIEKEPIFSKLYNVDPYDDINGVGLLYFASYSKINDKCERFYFQDNYGDNEGIQDWSESSYCIARDIHYYGNANANEELLYSLEYCEYLDKDKIQLTSSLRRTKDGELIAKIYTVKQIVTPIQLDLEAKKNVVKKEVTPSIVKPLEKHSEVTRSKKKLIQNTSLLVSDTDGNNVRYNREQLNTIIQDFLSKMFTSIEITTKTDIRHVGIESITLTELSEYLNVTHHLSSNPSKFFGLYTIDDITLHLLGESVSEEKGVFKKEIKTDEDSRDSDSVAIVGMSFRVPGANTKEELWDLLYHNKSTITTTPKARLNWPIWKNINPKHKNILSGGYINNIDKFDAQFFDISPQEATLMDPQQRIVLESVYSAIEDAGIPTESLAGSDTGVFMGVSGSDYATFRRGVDKEKIVAYDTIGVSHSILANRISYTLDIHGPSKAIDTACSSSLVALHEAVKSIKDSSCKIAIVGGVNAILNPEVTLSYNQAGMLSEDGSCKTFDERANGYVRSEGAGVIILKKLSEAEKGGDYIYGVVKGSSINHGGKANTLTTPNAKAQKKLLLEAYRSSGIQNPEEVSYIEAHGTGTPLGDPIEIEGIKLAFEEWYQTQGLEVPKTKHCGIGSIKANIGHLEAAAGIMGLIKVLLSMQHKILPGNPNLEVQNKYIEVEETPFYLIKSTSDWKEEGNHKRIAGVSSFGFGGANAHVVLEEYSPKQSKKYKSNDAAIILLSAKNKEQLDQRVIQLDKYLQTTKLVRLHDIAYSLQVGRTHMKERLAFKVTTVTQLKKDLINHQKGKLKKEYTGTFSETNKDAFLKEQLEKVDIKKLLKQKKADRLMQLWVKGIEMDWKLLYVGSNKPNKIILPTYPFTRERYWIEDIEMVNIPKVSQNITTKKLSIDDFIVKQICEFVHLSESALDKDEFISDYGIDSIQINQLTSAINNAFDLEVRPMELQSYLTISEIENFIEEELKSKKGTNEDNNNKEKQESERDNRNTVSDYKDIAIIGIDTEISGANSIEELGELLASETYHVTSFPKERWDSLPSHFTKGLSPTSFKGKFVDSLLNFDHKLFKISIREAMLMDPQHRLLLQSVWKSIENAGYTRGEFSKKRTAVFVAINGVDYGDIVKYDSKVDEFSGRGVKRYIGANRISNFFDLSGVSETIDTACSSFFVGVKKAVDAIRRGECDQAIISGVQANLLPFTFQEQLAQGILTTKDRTLPFSTDADGYVRSEGVCSIIIKEKSLAIFDKDQVYACIKGAGIAHGGRSLNITSPNVSSHKKAFVNALDDSNVNVDDILAIETHGTGMPFGDESELQAFHEIFSAKKRKTTTKCIIGAAKSTIGHLEAASGGLAILKSILTLQHGKMKGIKGTTDIHPNCNLEAFSISSEDQKLEVTTNKKATIGLHSYGIGGVSSFLILEKADETKQFIVEGTVERIFVLSAQSEFVLHKYKENIREYLQINSGKPWFNFDHFLATYQIRREVMRTRLAIVADCVEDLITALSDIQNNTSKLSIYGSASLQLPETFTSTKDMCVSANNWVDSGISEWDITTLSRYGYPNYPMDKRRSFWISQKQKEHSNIADIVKKEPVHTSKYLMLDI